MERSTTLYSWNSTPSGAAARRCVLCCFLLLLTLFLFSTNARADAPLRINCGSTASGTFLADQDFSPTTNPPTSTLTAGTKLITTTGVTNAAPQAIYNTQRRCTSTLTYTLPGFTANASYVVRLHFAEIFYSSTQTGSRLFNLSINGVVQETNFDIVAKAGAALKALVKDYNATANASGSIVLVFTTVKDSALVAGIEVLVPATRVSVANTSFDFFCIDTSSSATGTVTLTAPAPTGGATVNLQSDTASAGVPASVVVLAGQSSITFPVTYTAPIAPITATVTASLNGAATGQLDVFAAITLNAVTTGSGKITLYWEGVTGAIGYNIYRETVTGGPYTKINASPVTTLDSGPGLTNTYQFTNTSLTNGTEYFYYVTSVLTGGREGVRSDEASAIPDATRFISWDSGNGTTIMTQASTLEQSMRRSWQPAPDVIMVSGPDGVSYLQWAGGVVTAYAPNTYYDKSQSVIFYADGTTANFPYTYVTDLNCPMDNSSGGPYKAYVPNGGIYRKVVSSIGQVSLTSVVQLPLLTQTGEYSMKQWTLAESGLHPLNTNHKHDSSKKIITQDEAWVYVGSCEMGKQGTNDVGFQASWANKNWNISLGNDGAKMTFPWYDPNFAITANPSPFAQAGTVMLVYDTPGTGLATPDQYCTFGVSGAFIDKTTKNTFTQGYWIVPAKGWTSKNTSGRSIKRVNSIGQTQSVINAQDAIRMKHLPNRLDALGYIADGSFIGNALNDGVNTYGASWGLDANPLDNLLDAYVTLSGGYWDDTLTYNQGSFPSSNPPGTSSSQVSWKETINYYLENLIILTAK